MNHSSRWIPVFLAALVATLAGGTSLRGQSIEARNVLIRLMDEVNVPARSTGSLSEVSVKEGMKVAEGQVLAQIDATEATLNYNRAKYELEIAKEEATNDGAVKSAEKSLEYTKAHYDRLYRANVAQPRSVSESELEKARLDFEQAGFELDKSRSELRNAESREKLAANALALAQRNLQIRQIVSPQDGVVVESLHHRGEWVEPGERIFRIVSTKRLRAEGFVNAAHVKGDLKGRTVVLKPLSAVAGESAFYGKVVFVSPEIDPVNEEVLIYADVDNARSSLRPGMRVRMTISAESEQGG